MSRLWVSPLPTEVLVRRTALLVLSLLVLGGCSSNDNSTVTPAPSGGATTAAVTGTAIAIEAFAYLPTALTVDPGATIDVTNRDAQAHTVTSDVKGLFLADDINKGKPVTFKAPTRAGTYTFHCEYHSGMHGTLIVKG